MLGLSAGLLTAFALWTAAVATVDAAPIGPLESTVGFATLNGWVHRLTGVHWWLYHLTDWLSLVPIGLAAAFALLGLGQWIRRKDLRRVDHSLLLLGGFYLAVIAAYALFEGGGDQPSAGADRRRAGGFLPIIDHGTGAVCDAHGGDAAAPVCAQPGPRARACGFHDGLCPADGRWTAALWGALVHRRGGRCTAQRGTGVGVPGFPRPVRQIIRRLGFPKKQRRAPVSPGDPGGRRAFLCGIIAECVEVGVVLSQKCEHIELSATISTDN